MSAIISDPTTEVAIAQRNRTDVSWGAIFAGWVVSYGIAWLLFLLGSALGFSAIGFTDENIAQGLSWGTVIWILITWAVSMFLGGLSAAWLTGNPDRSIGSMHGLAVWALATILGLVIAGMTAVNVLQAGQSLLPGASIGQMIGGAPQQQTGQQNLAMAQATTALQAQLKQALSEAVASTARDAPGGGEAVSQEEARQAIEQLRPATLATVAGQLVRGDTEAAENTLVINTPLSRSEISQVMEGMTANVDQMRQQAQEAADQAAKYSAGALWALFFSSVLGLVMAAWGGWMGGRRVARRLGYVRT